MRRESAGNFEKNRINNITRVFIVHIDINSISSNFDMITSMVIKDNIDILMISETKIDSSIPQTQFRIGVYAPPFRYDRNSHDDGIFLFIREDIPAKIIIVTPLKKILKGLFAELNFRKKKILFSFSYSPHKLLHVLKILITIVYRFSSNKLS